MIVLRIHHHGSHRDVRLEKPRVVIGSDPAADVVETDAGWAPREIEILHRGTEIELKRVHRAGDLRLRVGDGVRIGRARLTLIGLLPLSEDLDDGEATTASPAVTTTPVEARGPAAAPERERELELETAADEPTGLPIADASLAFGGYEDDDAVESEGGAPTGPSLFELVDDLADPPAGRPDRPGGPAASPSDPSATRDGPDAPDIRSGAPPEEASPVPRPPPPPTRKAPPPKRADAGAPPSTKAVAGALTTTKGIPPLPRPPAPAFRHPSFGDELVRQARRAPFFLVSVALHILVFFALMILQSGARGGGEQGEKGTVHTTVMEAAPEERVGDEEEEEIDSPLPLLADIPMPEMPDEPTDPTTPPEPGDVLEPLPPDEAAPLLVGLNPSLTSVNASTGRSQNQLSPKDLKQTFAKREAITTNARAAEYVRSDLGRGAGRRGHLLDTVSRNDILVVDGTFDKVGKVLHALQLPFVRVPPRAIADKHAPDLAQHKVIFWNCGEALPAEQAAIATRRLRSFVRRGGFVFTTDWAIANVITLAFPGYVTTHGPRMPLPETVIAIRPAKGQTQNRLLDGVFARGVEGKWWLEQASYDIQVLRKREVTVLIESPDLKDLYRRDPAVAVTFPYHSGRVLHVMGHYFQEMGNLAGTISAQRLALNFIVMRLEKD